MNRIFIVVSLYLSIRGNKVARSGDEVREDQLCSHAGDLLAGGYIKEKEVQVGNMMLTPASPPVDPNAPLVPTGTVVLPLFTIQRDGKDHEVRTIDDIKKAEITALLKAHKEANEGFNFNPNDDKEVLFNILVPIMRVSKTTEEEKEGPEKE